MRRVQDQATAFLGAQFEAGRQAVQSMTLDPSGLVVVFRSKRGAGRPRLVEAEPAARQVLEQEVAALSEQNPRLEHH